MRRRVAICELRQCVGVEINTAPWPPTQLCRQCAAIACQECSKQLQHIPQLATLSHPFNLFAPAMPAAMQTPLSDTQLWISTRLACAFRNCSVPPATFRIVRCQGSPASCHHRAGQDPARGNLASSRSCVVYGRTNGGHMLKPLAGLCGGGASSRRCVRVAMRPAALAYPEFRNDVAGRRSFC